jgi:cytochrome c oxidase cbb3-type subunit 3
MMSAKTLLKYLSISAGISVIPLISLAQVTTDAPVKETPGKIPPLFFEPTTYLWALVIGLTFAVFIALSRAVKTLSDVVNQKQMMEESPTRVVRKDRVSTWSKLMKQLTRSVPLEQEADVMLDHDYDGIRELDNRLPPWWVWGFYATIAFAVVYLIHYHISGTGKLQLAEYNEEIRIAAQEKENRMKSDAGFVTEANVLALTDASALNEGMSLYQKNCVACHGNAGQGGVGPNLTDVFWIHGGGIKNIFKVIQDGVPAKGMISWKSQLSPKQIQAVSSYILTLEGTNPPDAKEAQGEKWEEAQPVSTANDSLQASNTQ